MSRRGKRQPARGLLTWLVALALVLAFAAWSVPAVPAGAQTATQPASTSAATAGTPAATAGTPGTPTPTATPTRTPTPTPTLTELQARLALAQAYLDGQDYENAAELYSDIVEDTRGNTAALEGLRAALAGKAAIFATQMAPIPTEPPPTPETPVPAPTLVSTTRSMARDAFGFVVAALLLIALLYLFGALLRWVLAALRELWYTRILPLLGRPAVPPGFLIGEFTGAWTAEEDVASRIVPVVVTQKLTEWNQLVRNKQVPIELEREPYTGPLAWLRGLWAWVLPPPRGYRVTGTFLAGPTGAHQLTVQRTNLGRHSVDRSRIFESTQEPPSEAYRVMAAETGKWLLIPADIEADRAVAMAKGTGNSSPAPSASAAFDHALETLLPVRHQVNQGSIDFPDARRRLRDAEALIAQLPTESSLRAELTRIVADLRRSVPGG